MSGIRSGVAGAPEASDEYRDYVQPVGAILMAGGTPAEVAGYLAGVERGMMEIEASEAHLTDVAARIVEWYSTAAPSTTDQADSA